MMPAAFRRALPVAALVLLVALPGQAGDVKSQSDFGGSFFSTSPPCPLRDFPTFESLVPVPGFIDPFEQDLTIFCEVRVDRKGKPLENAKGKYQAMLVVRDNNTGDLEEFPAGKGKFKTDSSGGAGFDFDLPSELFADGFESGDVSAWSYTRTDFTNRKRSDGASVVCGTGSTRSE
ncbi:MAG: hypothetical protein R3325_04085 [Thermoanaerobaculia bacterium]|nr:hypothetical protein [Thermoanaerobaculia bacterium]